MPKRLKNTPGVQLHKSHHWKTGKPEYYWIAVAPNGRTIAKSSESYTQKRAAIKSIDNTRFILGKAMNTGILDFTKKPKSK